ncbi:MULTISPECIES: hypothetical protein [Lysinibacillus]|uniref:Uncharacterized protein n=1 Tax=Lysinibacillus fusiformis TaxID=28031 RepID=A0A2I0V328_9BACI|nr:MULTISPECIES: hypothetical protein [Lysinibacillus]KUF37007.1 hypothetical protein AK833_01460 [Lysinibacillus sp. F5]PKU52698.1 hypothetical protein CRI88_10310 [Lysinibacillus fusiformis]SCY89276.1 hypothetical protein SAMN02787078_02927 [Lysinibacillus sp. SG9]SDB39389.1 hypothetical protein SAMN02787079_02968 [Lysinibacillus sp. TC-37]SFT03964.1 hypothetical protein SAMN02787087_03222 [Lysinibacillus sp. SG55]
MKNDKKTWQHLDDLMLSDQQQKKLLRNMTEPSVINKQKTKNKWKIPSVSLLFIVVLSILLLSFVQSPTNSPTTMDSSKAIQRIYLKENMNKETFIAQDSCLYVPQQCYAHAKAITQLQQNWDNASPVTISASQWKSGTIYDILILYNDRTQEKWKVLNNKIFFNVETQQAFLIEESFDSLRYFYDEKRSTKLIIGNIFILLMHFILWIAKKRMPYTERRFFAATVEHAIANAIMLVLFGGISFGIYLVHHTIHAVIIYGLFSLYSFMQIYYRKKAGEPQGYLIASALVQLCLAIAFTCLYLGLNVYF